MSRLYRHPMRPACFSATSNTNLWLCVIPTFAGRVGNKRRRSEHCVDDRVDILGHDHYNWYSIMCAVRTRLPPLLLSIWTMQVVWFRLLRIRRKEKRDYQEG